MRNAHTIPAADEYADRAEAFALDRWEDEGGAVPPAAEDAGAVSPGAVAAPPGNDTLSGLNRKVAAVGKPVYRTLAAHQRAEAGWDYRHLSVVLDTWYRLFNDHFDLNVPRVPLRLDPAVQRNCAGYFRPGHNEFGLLYEIAVAVPPPGGLDRIRLGDLLGTLLHELLHLDQELHGVPGQNNYHNVAYRDRAAAFGLLVDHRGHQEYAPDSPFLALLSRQGVGHPPAVRDSYAVAPGARPTAIRAVPKPAGKSKLRKWSCGCTNVWVGVATLHARCARPDCGRPFAPCG
ncbi:hypothetical protein [Fimbriiglobus ruber]|uniref:SprT-like domain-containing protein n=1 Tax=Fimbriiglobus ruber TaxID=1908690 RepID=A0A225DJ34_9BACT|nr:hypothetical protein [Fimbriiglobus ruber]OWK40993.1 hypothetical protein FRUB_04885 [Fimbriiglobus ruber]